MLSKRNFLVKALTFVLIFSILTGLMAIGSLADGAQEAPLTPAEAVADMTWGVNFPDFLMAAMTRTQGFEVGYCETAPFGMGIWYWNDYYDWLIYYQVHYGTMEISVTFPDYTPGHTSSWVEGLFAIGIFTRHKDQRIVLELDNSRIVYGNGDVKYLAAMDQTYDCTVSYGPNSNDYYNYNLVFNQSDFPEPGPELNGAVLKASVKVVEAPFASLEAKAEQFFEFDRIRTDPVELTELFMSQGMNVVRLPVSWTPFVKNDTFEIDKEWLETVKKQVDYCLSKGLYCMINMHEDYLQYSLVPDESGGYHRERLWMYPEYSRYVNSRFAAVWKQIAEYFKDYPDKLIFEVCNEPAMYWYESDQYDHPDHFETQIQKINELNNLFVETVRATGGENSTRLLGIAVANYDHYLYLDRLDLPDDEYLIVQLHSYTELEPSGTTYQIATDRLFDAVDTFVKRTGVPVMIGELGATHSGVNDSTLAPRAKYYFERAKMSGVPCLWWEDSFDAGTYHWLYDKKNHQWGRPLTLQAIKDALDIFTVNVNINGRDEWLSCSFDGACTVVAAVYDSSDRMLDCASIDRAAGDSYITLTLTPPQSSVQAKLKVFLLGQDSHTPLTKVLKI